MYPDNEYLPSLHALFQSGQKDNILLAIEIAEGLGIKEQLIQPWQELMDLVYTNPHQDFVCRLEIFMTFQVLKLSGEKLTEIPEAVFLLPALRLLYLNDNCLTTLPESLFALENLRVLELHSNQISIIPPSIAKLKNLNILLLNNNQISSLPKEIGELLLLKSLYIGKNRLKQLPNAIRKLNYLEILDISENPILYLNANRFKLNENLFVINCRGSFIYLKEQNPNYKIIYSDNGSIAEIIIEKGIFIAPEACINTYCSGSWIFCNCQYDYDHGYESYTNFEDGFEFSDLLEDAFHRNLKRYKIRP
jgi:hypothetical protein